MTYKEIMKTTIYFGMRMHPEMKAELEKAARENEMTVSELVRRIIKNWFNRKQILSGDDVTKI